MWYRVTNVSEKLM